MNFNKSDIISTNEDLSKLVDQKLCNDENTKYIITKYKLYSTFLSKGIQNP